MSEDLGTYERSGVATNTFVGLIVIGALAGMAGVVIESNASETIDHLFAAVLAVVGFGAMQVGLVAIAVSLGVRHARDH